MGMKHWPATRDEDRPRRTPRREFLQALTLGIASPIALSALASCDAENTEESAERGSAQPASALARELASHFDYLDIAPDVFDQFSREFERAYGIWRPEQANRPHARFLASTDFFQNGGDETRPLRYVRFYDPYLSPCYNPFSGLLG